MVRHSSRNEKLTHIVFQEMLMDCLGENVSSACSERWRLFAHAAVKQHQSTLWPLESSQECISACKIQPWKENLSKCFAVNRLNTWRPVKNKSLKKEDGHTKSGDQFLHMGCLWETKAYSIYWERLLSNAHMGNNHKHNIAFSAINCDSGTTLCSPRSFIYSGFRPRIIYHKYNKSPQTVDWSPFQWRHHFSQGHKVARNFPVYETLIECVFSLISHVYPPPFHNKRVLTRHV